MIYISLAIDVLQKENKYAAVVRDFDINLQYINEGGKFRKFSDMIRADIFYQNILPARYNTHPCTWLVKCFAKFHISRLLYFVVASRK